MLVFNIVCPRIVKATVTSITVYHYHLAEVTRSTGSESDVMIVARKTLFSAEDTHVLQEVTVTRIATSGVKLKSMAYRKWR
jgi:hypothetical protein